MSTGRAPHLFCFGFGFTAQALARRLRAEGWRVSGTTRTEARRQALAATNDIALTLFDRGRPIEGLRQLLADVTDVLVSVPPDAAGDPVLDRHRDDLAAAIGLRWVGYLSTTGVYGDTGGTRVDEDSSLNPSTDRSRRRVAAEQEWLCLAETTGLPVHIFRLAGIYGPGRSTIDRVRAGDARRIHRPGHLFSRIHVEDAAEVLRASIARPQPRQIYNVADDEPAEPAEVVAYACGLLDRPVPPLERFETAAASMSAMALSFWRDNRLVDNLKIKRDLGVRLKYPTFREGLASILRAETRDAADAIGSWDGAT